MTEIKNRGQAISKSKEYLVDPIGVPQEVVDDRSNYSQVDPSTEEGSSENNAWKIKWTGNWGDKFLSEMHIHIRRSDGVLLFWRNFGKEKNDHGAIGWQISRKHWIGG